MKNYNNYTADDLTLVVWTYKECKYLEESIQSIVSQTQKPQILISTSTPNEFVKNIARKYNIPIYATYGTIDGILTTRSLGQFDYNLLKPIKNDGSIIIGDIVVNTCPISHDANDPVCYNFLSNGKKVSVATDMGVYDNMTIDFLSESDAAVIETNHDIRMLEAGPYPYPVKKRIMGDRGHLCNEDGAKLIRDILSDHIKYIALGHLSDKNNYAELAFETVKNELEDNPFTNDVRDFGLCVAPRYEAGELIEI